MRYLERDIQKLRFAQLLLTEVLENLTEAYNNHAAKSDAMPTTDISAASSAIKLSRASTEVGWVASALEKIEEKC